MVEIIAQILSIIGMVISVLSFQQKRQAVLLAMSVFSCAVFMTSFLLLGAYVGAILNIIAAFRAVIFLYKDKFKSNHIAWFVVFVLVFVAIYILSFTVFGVKPTPLNFIIEVLPIIGMTVTHIGYRMNDAKMTRRFALINSPCWLIYNIYYMSIGAIIGEVLNIASVIIGILRHDINRGNKKDAQTTQNN